MFKRYLRSIKMGHPVCVCTYTYIYLQYNITIITLSLYHLDSLLLIPRIFPRRPILLQRQCLGNIISILQQLSPDFHLHEKVQSRQSPKMPHNLLFLRYRQIFRNCEGKVKYFNAQIKLNIIISFLFIDMKERLNI